MNKIEYWGFDERALTTKKKIKAKVNDGEKEMVLKNLMTREIKGASELLIQEIMKCNDLSKLDTIKELPYAVGVYVELIRFLKGKKNMFINSSMSTLENIKSINSTYNIKLDIDKYKTDIQALDNILDGGINRGEILQVSGVSGVGKSTLIFTAIKKALIDGEQVVMLDTNNNINKINLESFELDKFVYDADKNPNGNLIIFKISNFREVDEILSKAIDISNIIVINSIDTIVTDELMNNNVEDLSVNGKSKSIGNLLCKYKNLLRERNIITILVNHLSYNNNKDLLEESCGESLKKYSDTVIRLVDSASRNKGKTIEIIIKKSRNIEVDTKELISLEFGKGVSSLEEV